jgi:predicted DNA-binding transcriptional regulator AlpA
MPKTDAKALLKFLTEKEVSELTGLSVRTLRNWRLTHKGPRYRKFGDSVRYSVGDLEVWTQSVPYGGPVIEHPEGTA